MEWRKTVTVLIALFLVGGCAVTKVPQPTGGSKSDGVVELSYEYGTFEKPVVKWGEADRAARDRCSAWGYTDAERFGGGTRECNNYSGGTCNRWLVTVSYQCTGGQ